MVATTELQVILEDHKKKCCPQEIAYIQISIDGKDKIISGTVGC